MEDQERQKEEEECSKLSGEEVFLPTTTAKT